MQTSTQQLTTSEFAQVFGISEEQMPNGCVELIGCLDFTYRVLGSEERDEIILDVLKALQSKLPVSGPNRLNAWEEGWGQNLQELVATGNLNSLLPGYYRRGVGIMRLRNEYVLPSSPDFESNFLSVLRVWLAESFFQDVDHVYEFGCGPSHNLVAFAEMNPEKRYHGLDWATSSQQIIEHLAESQEYKIDGQQFDMLSPDPDYHIEPNSAVFTMGAMEQLGEGYQPFVNYLLEQKPKRCIHIEPIYELYHESTLMDYLAMQYSRRRGYLYGFLSELRNLEKSSAVTISDIQKIIGNKYHDGWSLVVWSPGNR
jgi:hypothetical protein